MLIYKITNKINGKIYIGQTTRTMEKRFNDHCSTYTRKIGIISLAIQKYGKDNFNIEKIYTASSLKDLNQKETYYIELFNSLSPNGYNLKKGGDNHEVHFETKIRMSESAKRKPKMSEETKRRISEGHKGEKSFWYGKKLPEYIVKQMSERAKTCIGEKNPMYGKNHTEEVKNKQSNRARGSKNGFAKLTEEQVKTIRYNYANNLNSINELSEMFNIKTGTVYGVIERRSWKHIT